MERLMSDDQAKSERTKSSRSKTEARKPAGTSAAASPSKRLKAKAKSGEKAAAETSATVRHEVDDITSDLTEKARKTASNTAARLRDVVEEQKTAGAERAKGIAGAINRAAGELDDEIPLAAHYVRKAAEELEHLSEEVRERDAGEILSIVEDFARRKPTMVLGATALVGFAAVRFLMTSAPSRRVSPDFDRTPTRSATRQDRADQETEATRMASEANDQSAPVVSGDPGGVSPQAPGFGSTASTSVSKES
jgi:uncharacterized phage infection (PIP) family protein YhgE